MVVSNEIENTTQIQKEGNNNYEMYYRLDHHWTSYGAYYAYIEYCKEKGITKEYLDDKLGFNTFIGYTLLGEPMTTGYAMNVFTKEEGKIINIIIETKAETDLAGAKEFGNSSILSYCFSYDII